MNRIDQLREMIKVETDECVLWPYALFRAGYGQVRSGKKNWRAHRLALVISSGSDEKDRDAAHACRSRSCVNPRHLQWETRSENNLDKRRDGTDLRGERHPSALLTNEDARHIRASRETAPVLADRYRVSRAVIYAIKHERTYTA